MAALIAGLAPLPKEREFSFIGDLEDLPDSIQALMKKYPLEDTDGCNLNLFEYLKTDIEGPRTSAKVPIPDTLLIRGGVIKAWYFWSPKEGRILKKKAGNAHCRRFYESLSQHPSSAFCAAYTVEEQTRPTEAGNRCVLLHYCDLEESRAVLGVEDPGPLYLGELIDRKATLEETVRGAPQISSDHFAFPRDGLIQRFLLPEVYEGMSEVNHVVKVRWTHAEGFSAARLACKRGLNDRKHSRLSRVATWDTNDAKLVDVIPFREHDPAVPALEDATARILQHVARLTRGNKQVAYIELFFKLDRTGCPWLLFCPYLRLLRDDMMETRTHFGILQPKPVKPPLYVLKGLWEEKHDQDTGEREVGPTDVFACVQCGTVHHMRYARKVPFRELQRYYETVVCFEKDGRVRAWLEDQVPPSILRADPSVSRHKYHRVRKEVSFLYKMARCCEACAEEVHRVTDRLLMAKKQPPLPYTRSTLFGHGAIDAPSSKPTALNVGLSVTSEGPRSPRNGPVRPSSNGGGGLIDAARQGIASSQGVRRGSLQVPLSASGGLRPSGSGTMLSAMERPVASPLTIQGTSGQALGPATPLQPSGSLKPAYLSSYVTQPMGPLPVELVLGPNAHRPQTSMLKLDGLDPSLLQKERERIARAADLEAQAQARADRQGRAPPSAVGAAPAPSVSGSNSGEAVPPSLSLYGTARPTARDRPQALLDAAISSNRGRVDALKAAVTPPDRTQAARNVVMLAASERLQEKRLGQEGRSRSPGPSSPTRDSLLASTTAGAGMSRFQREGAQRSLSGDRPVTQPLDSLNPKGAWAGATLGRRTAQPPLFRPASKKPSVNPAVPIVASETRALGPGEELAMVERLYSAPGAGRRRPQAKENQEGAVPVDRYFHPSNAILRANLVYRTQQPGENGHPSRSPSPPRSPAAADHRPLQRPRQPASPSKGSLPEKAQVRPSEERGTDPADVAQPRPLGSQRSVGSDNGSFSRSDVSKTVAASTAPGPSEALYPPPATVGESIPADPGTPIPSAGLEGPQEEGNRPSSNMGGGRRPLEDVLTSTEMQLLQTVIQESSMSTVGAGQVGAL